MRFILVGAALGLASCATPIMTEEECLAGDWETAGYEDGRSGRLLSAFAERTEACAPTGAVPDLVAYESGRANGLTVFCTGPAGFEFGRSGGAYRGVCTGDTETAFLSGFLPGRRLGGAERAVSAAQTEYNNAINALESARYDRRTARRTLDDPGASDKARERARRILEDSRRNILYTEERIDAASYELGRAEERLDTVLASADFWNEGPEFAALSSVLREANNFARAEPAINHCTDENTHGRPVCLVSAGAIVSSADGVLCAAGPGEARLARRGERPGQETIGAAHAYDFHELDERGRTRRRPDGFFEVDFGPDGAYQAVQCAPISPTREFPQ